MESGIKNVSFSSNEKKLLRYYYTNRERFISTKEAANHLRFKGASGVNSSIARIVKKILKFENRSPQKRNNGSDVFWKEIFDGVFTDNDKFYWKLKKEAISQLEYTEWLMQPEFEQRNYYIIGSKYKNDKTGYYVDIFPSMISKGVIAFGYGWNEDLNFLVGKTDKEKKDIIKDYKLESNQISHQIRKFTRIKPGDLIAIKLAGNYSPLIIRGYAIVKGNDDLKIIKDEELGNVIEVEYLYTDLNIEFSYHYAQTIYKIEDDQRIKSIFLECLNLINSGSNNIIESSPYINASIKKKQIDEVRINYTVDKIMSRKHNLIQQRIYDFFLQKYDDKNVFMEKNYVDVQVELASEVILFEIKPFESVVKCIKDALGQLLFYCLQDKEKIFKLRVVGPNMPNKIDEGYIKFLKRNIQLDFDYYAESQVYEEFK